MPGNMASGAAQAMNSQGLGPTVYVCGIALFAVVAWIWDIWDQKSRRDRDKTGSIRDDE